MPIPLEKILEAKLQDVPLQADDIVEVPGNKLKGAMGPLNVASLVLSMAIYRVP